MDKIAFVWPTDVHPRSPRTGCNRLALEIPKSIAVSDEEADYQELRGNGFKVFLYGHKPLMYKNRKLCPEALSDVVNSRVEFLETAVGIKCNSGFSYFKRFYDLYDCFFPTVTTFRRQEKPTKPCIGYYARGIRPDTNRMFLEFSNTIPDEVDIILMGQELPLKRHYKFTLDEQEFFSEVTHYFYMRSSKHDDPWPHTMFQACQCGCTLLMPSVSHPWRDGVDDVLDVCDVSPVDTLTVKNPWDVVRPCEWAPTGRMFYSLYEEISYSRWKWKPEIAWKSFGDVLNYSLSL